MLETLGLRESRRGLLLAAGLVVGLVVALGTVGLSWEAGALGLGLGLAALVGLAQTCSAWGYNAIYTIAPFVEGTRTHRRWLQRATVYALSMISAGTLLGAAFAAAGAILRAVWADAQVPLALALGVITLLYALGEVGYITVPVPGRDWQVPASWVREGFYRSAVIFGGTVGFGVFTRVPYASLPIMLAWLFVSGNIVYGALAGLVYGVCRAASIYSSAPYADTEELVGWNQRIMAMIPDVHAVTGLALAAFGAYLLLAPLI